jgi:peptidoglycan/LPS O-acetylase OafA/YrhL
MFKMISGKFFRPNFISGVAVDSRIEVLDSLRAFAALSVCLFHFVCTTTGYFKNGTLLSIFSVGKHGVEAFFVISGFVIPWSMYMGRYKLSNFFLFFLKRLSRLEPPYLVSVALAALFLFLRSVWIGTGEYTGLSFNRIALHVGYMIPFVKGYEWLNPVYWTLAIEFQYYLLMALVFVPFMKMNTFVRAVFYSVLLVAGQFSPSHVIFCWLPFFLPGIDLFLLKSGKINVKEYLFFSAALFSYLFFRFPAVSVFFALVPVVFVLFFSQKSVWGLNWIGKFSYSVYLIHPILGAAVVNVLSHYFTQPLQKALVVLVGLGFTLFCSWILYIFVEKPSKKFSASVRYDKSKMVVKV